MAAVAAVLQACGKEPESAGPGRAAAAAARVRPQLEAALKVQDLRFGDPVFVRAFKEERVLELYVLRRASNKFVVFRTYSIAAASGGLGPKLAAGDGQVPEGFYFVTAAAMKPDSTYHLAFNIGYPNAYDRYHQRTGDSIMVHGNEVSIGCLAMTDAKIEEIYTLCDAALRGGQKLFRVHVFPFRMSGERMAKARGNRWEAFWLNLKEGYDFFEKAGLPPDATVAKGVYQFSE